MSYLVLARKWRPKGFDDLTGQEPITRILSNAISQGRIAHAYLFSGPRGVGKTSTARILAKALNCENGPTPSPCGKCASCKSITEGSSVDVMEIDGASNNSVNDIRDLREGVKYAPAGARYKIYIIDEVHMLSDSAFNALLKTLEEPPPHVIFVLATTASRKIPATVLSRCQHLSFRRVPGHRIKERLKIISDSEGIRISDSALDMVVRAAEGSLRDSLTILDQVSAFSSDVTDDEIKDMLGIADFDALAEMASALINGDKKKIIALIEDLSDAGTDIKSFTKDLMQFIRDLLISRVVNKPEEILDISEHELNAIRKIAGVTSEDYLTLLLSELIKAEADIRSAFSPRVALEMSLLRASFLSSLKPLKDAIDHLDVFMKNDNVSLPEYEDTDGTYKTKLYRKNQVPLPEDVKVAHDTVSAEAEVICPSGPALCEDKEPPVKLNADPDELWTLLIRKIDEVNHPLAGKLSVAEGRMSGDKLVITFNGGTSIHADSIKKNLPVIEKAAADILNRKVMVSIEAVHKSVPKKKDIKEKIMSEPIIRQAIELFDGRIVDIKSITKTESGGEHV